MSFYETSQPEQPFISRERLGLYQQFLIHIKKIENYEAYEKQRVII